jgi:hypothetical protein
LSIYEVTVVCMTEGRIVKIGGASAGSSEPLWTRRGWRRAVPEPWMDSPVGQGGLVSAT